MIRPLLWLPLLAVSASATLAQEASLEKRAMKLHALASGTYCDEAGSGYVPDDAFQSWTFDYTPSWSDGSDTETVTLVQVFCTSGAYNVSHAFYWEREFDGLQPLSLAVPSFDIRYEVEDDIDSKVLGIDVTGMSTQAILVNAEFDPKAKVITAHSLWRGLGDASSSGTWFFDDGQFTLVQYEIDASYDGEANPEIVVDYLAAQGG
ncbi:DUF1176 domain-containing protein [Devosia salina]|uniref:DUF1176 domain-containing protein n=1 Tax=Devosia salina TaxID=2860336 RepID=A0ABX8WL57_9HYPH|nr:DUF1176 domain-containing protein [Devosia salina]QYO78519.1 DUF1176 domain-containing protein [Devosia salina]